MSEFKSLGDIGNEIAREVVARINAPPESAGRPLVEQIAMLMMLDPKATGEERHIVIGKLIDRVPGKPAWADFAVLVADGLCAKKPGDRWHTLTAEGSYEAKALLRHHCREFNLHRLKAGGQSSRYEMRYACTCGASMYVRKQPHAELRALSRFHSHLQFIDYRAEEAGMTRDEIAQRRLREEIAAPSVAPAQWEQSQDA